MLRILITLAAALFATQAVAYDDPLEAMKAFYAPYFSEPMDFSGQDNLRSIGLQALYEADAAEADGEIGRIDFDPYIQGQDWDTEVVTIGLPTVTGGTARVEVEFTNFDRPIRLTYSLVLERDGWKVDDVYWPADGEWPEGSLRQILAGPMP